MKDAHIACARTIYLHSGSPIAVDGNTLLVSMISDGDMYSKINIFIYLSYISLKINYLS